MWESLGAGWHSLCALWLQAEAILARTSIPDLSFTQICKSAIPDDWKKWMNAKLMKADMDCPQKGFGKVLMQYLKGPPSTTLAGSATVVTEIWCCPGVTGIVRLLLCLCWQANSPGSQKDLKANIKRVGSIYSAIIMVSDL